MFNSPSSTLHSPMRNELSSSLVRHFSQSPSDSRVPRTPSVATQCPSLDQSVPLTPNRQEVSESPQGLQMACRTPINRSSALADLNSSLLPSEHCSTSPQGTLLTGLQSCDQRVPSTPGNLPKVRAGRSPLIEQPLLSSPVSLVPRSRTTPRVQLLSEDFSPVPLINPEVYTCTSSERKLSSILDIDNMQEYERDFSSFEKSNHSRESQGSICSSGLLNTGISENQITNFSSEEIQNIISKPSPRSRRRLSLGRNDSLRRVAHQNLALKRSLGVAAFEKNSTSTSNSFPSTSSQNSHQAVALDTIIPPDGASSLVGYCHSPSPLKSGAENCHQSTPSPANLSLMSPTTDASNVEGDKSSKPNIPDRKNSGAEFDMGLPQYTSTPTTSCTTETKTGPGSKQLTLLDLIDDEEEEDVDKIFE